MYGNCQKCGKKLTDPESMIRGYGPECWGEIVKAYSKCAVQEDVPGQMDLFDFPEVLPEGTVKDGKEKDLSILPL